MVLVLWLACGDEYADPTREFAEPVEATQIHAVEVHTPPGLGRVDTPVTDVHGATVGIRCATCHEGEDAWAAAQGNPEGAHDTVDVQHGELTCNACHDADRTQLHLADGTPLEIEDARELCAQCHGVQHRDWERGSHGGMSGHWDRTRGTQLRNHCLDCHGAHAPAWEPVMPVLPPRDRGVAPSGGH